MTIATCHCGATRIELPQAPTHATQCTCTYCAKVGGLWSYYPVEAVRVVTASQPGFYSASGYNEHYFCARCGCTTHGISPDWSLGDTEVPTKKKFAVNARLLDDFDTSMLVIEEIDGRNLW